MFGKIKNLYKNFKEERKYFSKKREPFFKLAGQYLPKTSGAVVVDIGCGDETYFVRYLKLGEGGDYKVYNLDQAEGIGKHCDNFLHYIAPNRLPFDDSSVDYIHCSHLIEHLDIEDLYKLLREIDRVLTIDGTLVVSAPLFSRPFFEHPYHVKIYAPIFFELSMVDRAGTGCENGDGKVISKNFKIEKIVYRYTQTATERIWHSDYFLAELAIKMFLKLLYLLGFKKYTKDAYTIVMKKINE